MQSKLTLVFAFIPTFHVKPILNIYIIGCFIAAIFFFNSCYQPSDYEHSNKILTTKLQPSEDLFLQRAWPDASLDIKAYTKGLEQAQNDYLNRQSEHFNQNWMVQGPGNIGARINTLETHPTNDNVIYAGFSEGGVWRTIDGGASWIPIFDEQPFLAIGDITIDPNNPNVVYVGTGDPNISGFPFIGNGLYKSTDSGGTWTHLGLTETRIISKILINPSNSNIIYVATMGLPFERNNDRGLYKSTDGGASWTQVLSLGEDAGIIDLVMNTDNPQILFASGWNRIRNNSESLITGNKARVFRTMDGGMSWDTLYNGLPEEDLSRTGLAISPTNPNKVYAMFVSTGMQLHSIYKTEDGGENWEAMPTSEENGLDDHALGGFGWYFGKIRVHPLNDDQIYLLGVDMWTFQNGEWSLAAPEWWDYSVHADKHDLIFNSSNHLLLATDGGAYRSTDNGVNWEDIENIPTTQFYRTAYNPHQPNVYYGGAQDNGTTGGNAAGINDWERIYGGDGFQAVFHPTNPDIFYVETQRGGINMTLDGGFSWEGGTQGIENGDRRNWDMQYIMSSHNPERLYTGTYRVYESVSQDAPFWFPISEDLTDGTDDRYHTISTLHESPIDEDFLYVGTTDGRVWKTENSGNDWIEISAGLPNRYVTDIKASPDYTNWVYVTHSGYKDNDFIPRLHRSMNRGNTWENISGNLPDLAINDVYIIPNHLDTLIFVATDGGVYGTINSGEHWERVGVNMPIVPVYDLEWNVENQELIAATFARSILSYSLESLMVNIKNPIVQESLNIFPSPAWDEITIELTDEMIGQEATLLIFNQIGQQIWQQPITNQERVKVDVSDFSVGQYFVSIRGENNFKSGKVVIMR